MSLEKLQQVVLERERKRKDQPVARQTLISGAIQGPVKWQANRKPQPVNPALRTAITNFLLG